MQPECNPLDANPLWVVQLRRHSHRTQTCWCNREECTRMPTDFIERCKTLKGVHAEVNHRGDQKTDTSSSTSGSSNLSIAALIRLLSFGSRSSAVRKHRIAFAGCPSRL